MGERSNKQTHRSSPSDNLEKADSLAHRVIAWYIEKGRSLPWRRTTDPYFIWISEVMLQQTQVATVLPYYERFIRRFPTLKQLACADLQEVLKQWEGLGYYARARNLHRAAQVIMGEYGGQFPEDPANLISLPGIGRTTANAILSLAQRKRAPILDANIQRLLCRLYAIESDPREGSTKQHLWEMGERILPSKDFDRFNQGCMDLGSMVCIPKSPRCHECPLPPFCQASQKGIQDRIPPPRKSRPLPWINRVVGVIERKGHILIRQRPQQGLLGGLWEFPSVQVMDGIPPSQGLVEMLQREMGLSTELAGEICSFSHSYTHFRERIRVFRGIWLQGMQAAPPNNHWVLPQSLGEFPLSASHRRIARLLGGKAMSVVRQ